MAKSERIQEFPIYERIGMKLKKASDARLIGLWSLIGQKVTYSEEAKAHEEAIDTMFTEDFSAYQIMQEIIYTDVHAKKIYVKWMPNGKKRTKETIDKMQAMLDGAKDNASMIANCNSKFVVIISQEFESSDIEVSVWNYMENYN